MFVNEGIPSFKQRWNTLTSIKNRDTGIKKFKTRFKSFLSFYLLHH